MSDMIDYMAFLKYQTLICKTVIYFKAGVCLQKSL